MKDTWWSKVALEEKFEFTGSKKFGKQHFFADKFWKERFGELESNFLEERLGQQN